MGAVALQHRELILSEIEKGARLTDLASSLQVSPSAISHVLAKDPEYIAAREEGLEARMDKREAELESADSSLKVARARELLSHARWRAEREAPARWGQKSEVNHQVVVPILSISVASPQHAAVQELPASGLVIEQKDVTP